MKKFFITLVLALSLFGFGWILINYWSPIFSKTVSGRIEGLERVEPNSTLFSGSSRSTSRSSDKILFSFAIAIRNVNGDIVTASTEDRQWAVAKVGQCVQAKVFPYPPWDLEKAGTFFGARLKNLSDCNPKDWPKNLQPTQPAQSEQPVIQEPIQPSNSLHENSKSLNEEPVEDKSTEIESSVE